MDIEKLKLEAQNKALHIADVSGSVTYQDVTYNWGVIVTGKQIGRAHV